jgi:hypothetical protein
MKNNLKMPASVIALCIIVLSGFARPLDNEGTDQGFREDDPITIGNNTYTYPFTLSDLEGLPATKVIPPIFSDGSYDVGEGVTGYVSTQIKMKWESDKFLKNRNPVTPVVCIDMGEHYFIAQFYEGAPGQYGALVLGQDGYVYNVYSFFCEFLSSEMYKCWGLPIGDTQKQYDGAYPYFTILVQTDPCFGSKISTLYISYVEISKLSAELRSILLEAGVCGMGTVYSNN